MDPTVKVNTKHEKIDKTTHQDEIRSYAKGEMVSLLITTGKRRGHKMPRLQP